MMSLEGANCADLPAFVIDKYFDCNVSEEPLRAKVAQAICAHCRVLEQCRDEALTRPFPPKRGIIAGVSANQISIARSWRFYEQGHIERVPPYPRPTWLGRTGATDTAEETRIESDADEPPTER